MEFGRPTRAVEEEEKEEEVARDAERTPPPEYEPGREAQMEEGEHKGTHRKTHPEIKTSRPNSHRKSRGDGCGTSSTVNALGKLPATT